MTALLKSLIRAAVSRATIVVVDRTIIQPAINITVRRGHSGKLWAAIGPLGQEILVPGNYRVRIEQ